MIMTEGRGHLESGKVMRNKAHQVEGGGGGGFQAEGIAPAKARRFESSVAKGQPGAPVTVCWGQGQ